VAQLDPLDRRAPLAQLEQLDPQVPPGHKERKEALALKALQALLDQLVLVPRVQQEQ